MSLVKGRFRTDLKYKAIIDKAIAGDRVVTHVYFDDGSDIELVTLLAGFRTPRSSGKDTTAEPFGDEARKYIEQRLVGQKVLVTFIGTSSTDVPIVKAYHPAGNISEKILAAGLAEVADWQSQLIGSQGMALLRAAEKTARVAGKGLWKSNKPAAVTTSGSSTSSTLKVGATVDATIGRIVSSDTISVFLANDKEQLVHLTSVRAPRASEPLGVFIPQAKEFLRKYVGKRVKLTADAVRNDTTLVSAELQNGKNLNELVVFNGFATVIRHRRGDDDRAANWDALIEAEDQAIKAKRGIHSSKKPQPEKYIEASQDSNRAKTHLRQLKAKGKFNAIVDHVISPTRLRIIVPVDNLRIVVVLAGVMGSGRDDPISEKAIAYNARNIAQRDISVQVFDNDNFGGFISTVTVHGQSEPYQLQLLSNGLAQTHGGSMVHIAHENAFYDAEENALNVRLNIWENYDPVEEEKKYQEEQEKRKAKQELKQAKYKNAFDSDDEEEDLDNLPEAVKNLIIRR